MPRLSDVAKVTTRGGNVPDTENELAYSAYCLYEAVKVEIRKSSYESVSRGGIPGLEGQVSVPKALKFLWPSMSRMDKGDDDSPADKARADMYKYLRETKNLVCINRGNVRMMSTWWVRGEWNDLPPQPERSERSKRTFEAAETTLTTTPREAEAASPPAVVFHPAAEEMNDMTAASRKPPTHSRSDPCRHCGRVFLTTGHLTRHVYRDHEDLSDLVIIVLGEADKPLGLFDLTKILVSRFSYTGSSQAVRDRLTPLLEDGLVETKPGDLPVPSYAMVTGIAFGTRYHEATERVAALRGQVPETPQPESSPEPESVPERLAPLPVVMPPKPEISLEDAEAAFAYLTAGSQILAGLLEGYKKLLRENESLRKKLEQLKAGTLPIEQPEPREQQEPIVTPSSDSENEQLRIENASLRSQLDSLRVLIANLK